MPNRGFWDFGDYWQTLTSGQTWFDAEWKQRRDINQLEVDDQQVQFDVSLLRKALAQTQKQMLELSMTVVVMAQMLDEAKLLDMTALHARLDAELEKLRPKPAPKGSLEAHPAKAKPLDTPVECGRCGTSVPSSKTTITVKYGTVCDRCAELM